MNDRNHKGHFFEIAEAYLKQRFFDENQPIQFNPLKFRRGWRVGLLERCWKLDYEIEACRLNLETHWQEVNPPLAKRL